MKQLRMLSIVMKLVQLPTGGNVMRSLPMISLLLALVLASCKPVTPQAAQLGSQLSLAQPGADKIVNAMSGGLPSFARNATILDWPAKKGAAPVKLRDGTNGWVCRPDDPTTPTNDPRCFEPNWLKLFGKPFDTSREAQKAFGIGYMLQGGSAADNFDLKAIEPATGQDWVIDGPHVMLIFSSDKTSAAFSTEHHTGGPYMMFKGSPSEHLMIPTLADAVPSKNDPIRNAISAAPLKIAENAAIMDWPKKAGDDLVRLRDGTNGWTCLTDDPTTPTNDPMCLDKQWMEWINAFMAGRAPKYTDVGIGYMLQGGSGASSTDPMLTKPPAGKDWMVDGPHIMVVVPWDLDSAFYSTDPKSGGPYIMFEGTPYEHLMVPATEMSH